VRIGRVDPKLVVVLLGGLLVASPSLADWLILKDGSRVETKGGWEVKGPMVVFHLANGTFSSLRLDSVDLQASEAATVEAKKPKPEPEVKEAREPVLVLTDADVGHVVPEPLQPTLEEDSGEAANQPEAVTPGEAGRTPQGFAQPDRVQVLDWDEVQSENGIAFEGSIRNISAAVVGDVSLEVFLEDDEGELLRSRMAILGATALRPGGHTRFRADFPGTFGYSDVRFEVSHVALDTSSRSESDDELRGPENG